MAGNELILFESQDKSILLNVPLRNDSVWLNRNQMDVEGEAKQKLTVVDLLNLFTKASGHEFANDRAILS